MLITGIVRRIDTLGRIVIPKEIRRAHNIQDGDPVEICPTKEGIVLHKYVPVDAADIELIALKTLQLVEQLPESHPLEQQLLNSVKILRQVREVLGDAQKGITATIKQKDEE